jgi:hypothetical protein
MRQNKSLRNSRVHDMFNSSAVEIEFGSFSAPAKHARFGAQGSEMFVPLDKVGD